MSPTDFVQTWRDMSSTTRRLTITSAVLQPLAFYAGISLVADALEMLGKGGWWQLLALYLAACAVALVWLWGSIGWLSRLGETISAAYAKHELLGAELDRMRARADQPESDIE